MTFPKPTIRVAVDLTNPGQFFACCGLLELADRLSPGVEGWFTHSTFQISASGIDLPTILARLLETVITSDDLSADESACPIRIGSPFNLRVDWWLDEIGVGASLKTWSGRQKGLDMARATMESLPSATNNDDLLDISKAITIQKPGKQKMMRESVEPFCFDPRRGANALRDGFSTDALSMEVVAYPGVEFLAMVGLQRCRPQRAEKRRSFIYSAWSTPLALIVAPAAVCGAVDLSTLGAFQFGLAFRDAAKRYKYFDFACRKEFL